jgi:hypothetical protein
MAGRGITSWVNDRKLFPTFSALPPSMGFYILTAVSDIQKVLTLDGREQGGREGVNYGLIMRPLIRVCFTRAKNTG